MLTTSSIVMARAMGLVLVMPFFVRLGVSGLVRAGVALAFCLPIFPALNATLGAEPATVSTALLAMKELLVGIIIGIAFGVPFWAAEIAGDLLDLQRGSTAAQLVDASSITESSINATFFSLAAMLIFVSSGGLLVVLEGLYQSYAIWPAATFSPVLGAQSVTLVLATLDRVLHTAMLLIAPLVLALLVADIMLAFLSRIAPQLHVFDLSLSIKNLLFSLLVVLYSAFLAPMMHSEIGKMRETRQWLQQLQPETDTNWPRDTP